MHTWLPAYVWKNAKKEERFTFKIEDPHNLKTWFAFGKDDGDSEEYLSSWRAGKATNGRTAGAFSLGLHFKFFSPSDSN